MNTSLPPVFFNHLYVVLDDKTYRAIQASDFLRNAFPGMERRATLTAAGETWYGTYYYCRNNYLEFFGESTGRHWQPGAQVGWAGLAYSTDQVGGVASVKNALREQYHYEPFSELRQLRTPQNTINWFYYVSLAERLGLGSFDSWVMEYHPDIFAHKNIASQEQNIRSRQEYLSSWNKNRWEEPKNLEALAATLKTSPAETQRDHSTGEPGKNHQSAPSEASIEASLGKEKQVLGSDVTHQPARIRKDQRVPSQQEPPSLDIPRTAIFSSVIGATVHMDARRAERYAEILRLFGYAQDQTPDGLALSAHGFTVRIRPEDAAPAGYRLSTLRLQMARPSVAPMTFVFATGSRLTLNEDLTADWHFGR